MGSADNKDERQDPKSDNDGLRGPWARLNGFGRRFGARVGRNAGTLVPALLALGGLGLAVWFLAFTSPGRAPADVANLNVSVDAPTGAITTANASTEARLTANGGAAVTVEVYFVCQASATPTIELISREARRVDYSPESPGPRLEDSLLSSPVIHRVDNGIQVSGPCVENNPINVPFSVEFPAGTVAAPLERGRYAFGMDLFIANLSNVIAENSYAIGIVTPDGALLTEAFDAQGRTFNRATWEAESGFSRPAYGTYSMPEEVAEARLWENVILLLLGAVVGIALEAVLRRVGSRRS